MHTKSDRTNETLIRSILPEYLPGVGKIVATGRFTPGGEGCYSGFFVSCQRPNVASPRLAFSTHHAVWNDEREEWFSISGHYDMTELDALGDLLKR